MKNSLLYLTLLLLSACSVTPPVGDKVAKPDECPVTKIDDRQQRELCEHFAGEEPYDAERAAYLKKKMDELNCGLYF